MIQEHKYCDSPSCFGSAVEVYTRLHEEGHWETVYDGEELDALREMSEEDFKDFAMSFEDYFWRDEGISKSLEMVHFLHARALARWLKERG